MSRRPSNESTKSSNAIGKRSGKMAKNINNGIFSWDKYLQQTGMPAAPDECFKQKAYDETISNKFKLGDKLEAKDARNPSAISVASVVQIQGLRLCLRLDGTDGCNDFWRMIDSRDIFPLGTCEAHGGLLQPPLGYTRVVSTWPNFLRRTLQNASQAHADCFFEEPLRPSSNQFEIGMKLEAVDKKNPQLICPATIGDVDGDQIFVSFDGWRGAFDYWCSYDSRDLFPVGWCQKNNHPMQDPGKKGDNPTVTEKLKLVAERRKRQTRSVKSNLDQKQLTKETVSSQIKEKPVRRRRVDSIKVSKHFEDEKPTQQSSKLQPSKLTTQNTDDDSVSSDDSDSSKDVFEEKRRKLSSNDGESVSTDENLNSCLSSNNQSKDSSLYTQQSDQQDLRKIERQERKRKQRKLARVFKRAGIAQDQIGKIKEDGVAVSLNLTPEQVALLTSPRKRPSVTEPDFLKSKLKRKKKRRRLIEPTYTRLEGFGLKASELGSNTATTVNTSPTSPSFMDALTTPAPTSLFGIDKSQIVRDATQGWPARLQIVSSDNKLGRFDKVLPEKDSVATTSTEMASAEPSTSQCVSTTTNETEATSPSEKPPTNSTNHTTVPPFVSSTTAPDIIQSEDAGKVSSTTNNLPIHKEASTLPVSQTITNQSTTAKVTSTVSTIVEKRRSRNPKKWSIDDVIDYVKEKEPALHGNVAVFQKHEIDGKAFLLLNSSNIVKYMGLKLGPALKLCTLVENLKVSIEKHLGKQRGKKQQI